MKAETMTAGKVLVVRAAGPSAFGMTPAERLERLAARTKMGLARDPGEADLIIRGDHVYGASVFNALADAAPGTVLVDAGGRALAARVDESSRGWALGLLDRAHPTAEIPEQAAITDAGALAGAHNIRLRKRLKPC